MIPLPLNMGVEPLAVAAIPARKNTKKTKGRQADIKCLQQNRCLRFSLCPKQGVALFRKYSPKG